ncbi:MAG: hypothetical protein IPI28_08455 [Candidatus Omnitrophica bacterium]|nr:hypothetical protein [Candidatus Omnitrophota bacterium]
MKAPGKEIRQQQSGNQVAATRQRSGKADQKWPERVKSAGHRAGDISMLAEKEVMLGIPCFIDAVAVGSAWGILKFP